MSTVTISRGCQLRIPRKIRQQLGLEPGQKLQVLVYDNRIELIPVRRMHEMRGFLRGLDTSRWRDRDGS